MLRLEQFVSVSGGNATASSRVAFGELPVREARAPFEKVAHGPISGIRPAAVRSMAYSPNVRFVPSGAGTAGSVTPSAVNAS